MKKSNTKAADNTHAVYKNPDLPIQERVKDLVSRLTLEEKITQMLYDAPAIPRLGIQEHNWWNECLHGVGRAGIATVFPQAIGMAASFNQKLMYRVAAAISDEARAKHHEFARQGDRGIYKGLTFWTPNVNIFRDPRWGRGQETYGEDPYLSGRMGVAFIKGLQGDDPKYLKLAATPKHFAVHSGPEALRHHFDARVSLKDLRETYLPSFRDCIREAKAASIMGAYNRTNGEPCCASPTLLQNILRDEWQFDGYVVSDCGAIKDFHQHHMVTSSPEKSAALAVNNGCDLNCGKIYESLKEAVRQGLITEETINLSVSRLMHVRMRLGMFDSLEGQAYAQIPYLQNDCEEHRDLARQMARESIVLLKNDRDILPLKKDLKCIAVIGPNADDRNVLLGNYNGFPSRSVTVLEGIRAAVSTETEVIYARGCDWLNMQEDAAGCKPDHGFSEAAAAIECADVVIICLGITPEIEGEEGSADKSDWAGDRIRIDLPDIQQSFLQAVHAKGKPVILILLSGSAIAINREQELTSAILQAWYPGEEGGTALAEVLFADYNPSGRLPITFVKSLDQLPPFTDYSMKGRTYRYLEDEPLYPFGYGLSYTQFEYSRLKINKEKVQSGESVEVNVEIRNTGSHAGDEVVQLYLSDPDASVCVPGWELKGFTRIHLKAGGTETVSFTVTPRQMALIDEQGRCILEPGKFRVYVGGTQPDTRSRALTGKTVLSVEFDLIGESREIE